MGLFLNIEGGDGSGKATQTKLLGEFARAQGMNVYEDAFPRYHTPTGQIVRAYLRGELGFTSSDRSIEDLKTTSQFYADDRLAAKADMMPFLEDPHGLVLTDRFTPSNMAHMGGFILDLEERKAFYEYIRHNEHEVMGIPKPDHNLILMIPARISQRNIDERNRRNGIVDQPDIHEQSTGHLERAHTAYAEMAQLYPDEFTLVNSMESYDTMRTIDDIQAELRTVATRLLQLSA